MSCGQDLDSDLEEAPSWDFCFHLRPKSTEGQNNLNEVNTFMFNTLYSLAMWDYWTSRACEEKVLQNPLAKVCPEGLWRVGQDRKGGFKVQNNHRHEVVLRVGWLRHCVHKRSAGKRGWGEATLSPRRLHSHTAERHFLLEIFVRFVKYIENVKPLVLKASLLLVTAQVPSCYTVCTNSNQKFPSSVCLTVWMKCQKKRVWFCIFCIHLDRLPSRFSRKMSHFSILSQKNVNIVWNSEIWNIFLLGVKKCVQ